MGLLRPYPVRCFIRRAGGYSEGGGGSCGDGKSDWLPRKSLKGERGERNRPLLCVVPRCGVQPRLMLERTYNTAVADETGGGCVVPDVDIEGGEDGSAEEAEMQQRRAVG